MASHPGMYSLVADHIRVYAAIEAERYVVGKCSCAHELHLLADPIRGVTMCARNCDNTGSKGRRRCARNAPHQILITDLYESVSSRSP